MRRDRTLVSTATRVMLAVNSAIWAAFTLLLGTGFVSVGDVDIGATRLIAALMAGNAVVPGSCAWQVIRGQKLVDRAALVVLAVNALLSLTDEVGVYDLAMFAFSLIILACLIQAIRLVGRNDVTATGAYVSAG